MDTQRWYIIDFVVFIKKNKLRARFTVFDMKKDEVSLTDFEGLKDYINQTFDNSIIQQIS